MFRHLIAVAALTIAVPASAGNVTVAVAANFTEPAKEIAAAFQAATGHTTTLSFGSSGGFYTQITHGAPFDIFLSADAERPMQVERDGFAVPRTRSTYAVGRLVLYSLSPDLIDAKGGVLRRGGFAHLAIADPVLAPYGAAAVETLQKLKLYDAVAPKLVKGTSVTQAYQFVATGAAELGFVAASQVVNVPGGSRWLVPAVDHKPIEQQAVLLKAGATNPAAIAFIKFLNGRAAKAIIKHYGYDVR